MDDGDKQASIDRLVEWQARDAEVRAVTREFGVATRAQLAGKSGSEIFRAMMAGEIPAPPITRTLDFILVGADVGRVVFQGRPGFAHYNPMGTVHGGWFATLLDSALGCAVQTSLPPGKAYTTAELKINIVRPLTDKVPLVRAEGTIIHAGGRMATADGRLVGPDGKLYAHASTTCFVYDASP
ncbi:MAG: PaaI family thioesterase [Caldimonas sp.]